VETIILAQVAAVLAQAAAQVEQVQPAVAA
jgi:hypothetical protein